MDWETKEKWDKFEKQKMLAQKSIETKVSQFDKQYTEKDAEDKKILHNLQEKIDKATRNVEQGELGLELAQAKTMDIKNDLTTIEANMAIESAAALQKEQEEAKKEKPSPSDGSVEKMMKKKVTFVEKKIKAINELEKQLPNAAQDNFDGSLTKMKTLLQSTEKGMAEINDKIKEKQRHNENTGAVSDADWEKQMNFVLKE